MKKKKIKIPARIITAAAVCSLFFLSGCASYKNMLAAFFWGNSGNAVSFHGASSDRQTIRPDTAYQLARHFQKSGLHHKAVAELLKVVRADPEHASAYNALGVSYDRLRQFDLAAVSYREALKINPDLDYVYNNIGYSNLLQGNLDAAARAFETAVSLNSEKQLYQNNLALVNARLGRDKTAQAVVQTTRESAPAFTPQLSDIEVQYASTAGADGSEAATAGTAARDTSDTVQQDTSDTVQQDIGYTVQLGVYYDIDKALSAVKDAQAMGYKRVYINKVDRGKLYDPYFRVRFGKYPDREQAEGMAAEIRSCSRKSTCVVIETSSPENVYAMTDVKFNDRDMRPTIIKTNHDIEILNGNGVQNMARKMRQYLTRQGIDVKKIANARHFNHPRTIIYYSPGYYAEAQKLLAQIHKIQPAGKIVESKNLEKTIQIVLGRDIRPAAGKLLKKS